MNEMTEAQQRERIRRFMGAKMAESVMMYLQYPEGYDQRVAVWNNHIFADVMPCEFPRATLAAAHVLLDSGMAQVMSRAYY